MIVKNCDENGEFPEGAQFDPDAPYNQSDKKTSDVTFRVYGDVYQDVTITIPAEDEPWDYRDEVYNSIKEDEWNYPDIVDIDIIHENYGNS